METLVSGVCLYCVEDMSEMFAHSDFDGVISKWDVSSVKYKQFMFEESAFSGGKIIS